MATLNASEQYALSALQQGMLYHHISEPGSGTDIEQMVCSLPEALDLPRLRQAWDAIVARHATLRTQFESTEQGIPVQRIVPEAALPWEFLDWRGQDKTRQQQALESFLKVDRHRGFVMNRAPLMRLTLIRTAEDGYELVWTFHHILMDGRSFPIVLGEVFELYDGTPDAAADTPAPRRPYSDYIHWLEAQDWTKSEQYWRNQLDGVLSPTPLAAGAPPAVPPAPEDRQSDENIVLDAANTGALRALAAELGVTLNTVVQAAWALLLSRYSGDGEVIFGVVRACRKSSIEGASDMLGLFINTVPMRIAVDGGRPVREWLKGIRAVWEGMRDHEHTPLARIQKCSALPAGTPLFESILMFETYQLDDLLRQTRRNWQHRSLRLYEQTGYPITVTVFAAADLKIKIEYDCRRFTQQTIRHMLGHLCRILEEIAADSSRPVSSLPMLTDKERQQILVEWNHTESEYPRERMVHQLFEAQAEQSPDAVAVVFEERSLTYGELNARANRLAHELRAAGVTPDSLVGICVERSLEMVVAVLAVLKSGAAYLPLDPAFPKDRLAIILEDARAGVLVTQEKLLGNLAVTGEHVILLDRIDLSARGEENPVPVSGPRNLAYVIFTSGSTGRPKGVQIEHASVVNFLESMAREPGLSARDTLVAVTTLSFDIAGLELFLPLTCGARVVVASSAMALDGRNLARLLDRVEATMLQATPITWRLLLESGWSGRPGMKILCGGEPMAPELAEKLLPRCESLWNVYGPTETTIWSTVHRVTAPEVPIPIGKPLANTTVYVLDHALQPVPVGVTGELYIGGDGVARGYHCRPELTAERFVANPFDPSRRTRLYKTGDLSRWRPDGVLECLGRSDFQVKIRGYRIELGEIEAVLARHPQVKQAVANVQGGVGEEKTLVAYLSSQDGAPLEAAGLRDFAARHLPDYMVPALYATVPRFPMTPNGKVDRKALPKIEPAVAAEAVSASSEPLSETEAKVARVWEQVLGVGNIRRDSNFFDLGGHSLLIIRIQNKLEECFGKELPVVEVFRNPTVRALARYLGGEAEAETMVQTSGREAAGAQRKAMRERMQRRRQEGQLQ